MGNFWIPQFDSSSSSSPCSTRPSSPAISKNSSNEGTHSGTTSAFTSSINEASPKIFSFAELKKATRKFSPDTLLGEGGFGQVFKGWIDEKTLGSGTAIAVKKMSPEGLQGREEWQNKQEEMVTRPTVPNQNRGGAATVGNKKPMAAAEAKNRRALGDIGNLVNVRVLEGKPQQISRPVTRSFCAQLLANAQAAAAANKKSTDEKSLLVKTEGLLDQPDKWKLPALL